MTLTMTRFPLLGRLVLGLVASVALLSGCDAKTYVHLSIESGATAVAGIASIEVQLELEGRTETATLTEKGAATITLPTAVTFEIQKGAGLLSLVAIAKNSAGTELTRGTKTTTVTRGQTARATITFGQGDTPDLAGTDSTPPDLAGTVDDLTNGADLTASPPSLSIDETTHDFQMVVQGTTSAPASFVITNTGGDTATGITVVLSGADAARFALSSDSCTGATLASTQTCTVAVTFSPNALGLVSGVVLTVTPSTGSAVSATLQGTGTAPGALVLTGDGAFGIVDTTSSLAKDFVVTNNGGSNVGPLVVSSTDDAQFTAAMTGTTCAGATVPPGLSCTQRVTFKPSAFGSKSATLNVSVASGPSASTNMTGTGRDTVVLSATTGGSGSGAVTGSGLNCGNGNATCSVNITRTTSSPSVTLTATPNPANSTFGMWGGACTSAGSATTCNLTMSANQAVSASFNTATIVQLTVTNSGGILGATGSVASGDGRISCGGTCSAGYAQNAATMVTLTATPSSGNIVLWGGACSGSATTCTVSMGAARAVTARFRPPKNIMFVTKDASITGNTGGPTGADTLCANYAIAANLPGTYKAYLPDSVAGRTAAARLQTFNAGVRGWLRRDGTVFADFLSTLNSSGPSSAPCINEDGTNECSTGIYAVRTGSASDGSIATGYNCTNWTTTTGDVYKGNLTLSTYQWQTYQNVITGCDGGSRLYCFGVDYSNAP